MIRDPLICAYKAIGKAIQTVHGEQFRVLDEIPNPIEFKKVLPAANITYVSGTVEKALMREYEPHGMIKNANGTYTAGTEAVRFDYMIQVSFFANKPGIAQRLSTAFMAYVETENEIPVPDDKWNEIMQIFLAAPPLPARGMTDLYQVDATYTCRGRLITEEVVNAIDVSKFKPKIS